MVEQCDGKVSEIVNGRSRRGATEKKSSERSRLEGRGFSVAFL